MSTKTEMEHASEHSAAHHHTPPYIQVFVILTILTAIEVTPIFADIFFDIRIMPHEYVVPILLLIAIVKSALVALYYMHLKYDQPWLIWIIMVPFAFAMFFGLVIVAPYN